MARSIAWLQYGQRASGVVGLVWPGAPLVPSFTELAPSWSALSSGGSICAAPSSMVQHTRTGCVDWKPGSSSTVILACAASAAAMCRVCRGIRCWRYLGPSRKCMDVSGSCDMLEDCDLGWVYREEEGLGRRTIRAEVWTLLLEAEARPGRVRGEIDYGAA
jgi:hypothetical protein